MKNSVFHLNESAQRNLARRSVFAFAVLASLYSKSFLLGTLYYYCIVVSIFYVDRIHQSPLCLPIPPLRDNAHFYAELRFSPFSSSSPTDESIFGIFGGECRTRTCDIVHHKQVVKIAVTVFDKTKLLTRSTY
jgi:hypothetical protein